MIYTGRVDRKTSFGSLNLIVKSSTENEDENTINGAVTTLGRLKEKRGA